MDSKPILDAFGEQALDTWSIRKTTGKLNIIQRVQLALKQVERAAIGGLDASQLALIPDFSHWNGEIDLTQMGDLGGMWTKACDGKQMYAGDGSDKQNYIDKTLRANIQKAYDAKIPCGVYIYFQPIITDYTHQSIIDWHYAVFKEAVKGLIPGKSFHAIAIDVEERGDTGVNIRDKVMGLYKLLREDPAFASLPIYFYTSISILNQYAAWSDAISNPNANYNLWMAQWAYNGTRTTWANLRSVIIPALSMKVLTPGYATWKMLQWGVFSGLAGCPGGCDLSFYKGTKAAFQKEWNYAQPVTPPPPDVPDEPQPQDNPDLAALTLRVAELERWRKS